jgi:hypothetical protein
MSTHDARILEAADISEITQLILRERESRDLGRWAEMRECFHDDALIRISWITGNTEQFVQGSIDMARRGMLAKHRLGPVLVRVGRPGSAGENRAVATLGGAIDIPVKIGDVDAQLSSYARFLYPAERRGQRWKLSGFNAAYLRDELVPTVPGQTLRVPPEALKGFRKSYQMLSYVLTLSAYQVNSDLAGDDRPETVRALETQLFDWAGVKP